MEMANPHPIRKFVRAEHLLCFAVLIFAAVLRLSRLELVSVTADEGIHGMSAMNVAIFQDWPLVGLPSVGIRNSAAFIYLLAIPNFLYRHPLSGAVFVASLNLIAVFLCYRLARTWYGVRAGVVASLLYAGAPWMVLYGRQMWPPSCLAVFCLVLILLSLRWLEEGGNRRLTGMLALACMIPQVHFSGFCAPVWLIAVLALGRKRLRLGPMAAGLLIGLATCTPWVVFQQLDGWNDLRAVLGAARGKHGVAETVLGAANWLQTLMQSGGFEYWFAVSPETMPELFPGWLLFACRASGLVLVVLLLVAVLWCLRSSGDQKLRLLLLWSVLPIFMLGVLRPEMHPHYVLVAYPAPLLIIGAFLGKLTESGRPFRRWIAYGVLSMVCACHVLFLIGWYRYVDAGELTGQGQYQFCYRQRLAAARSILDESQGRLVHLSGPFNGAHPAYELPYNFEQMRRGFDRFPLDSQHLYWVDESPDETVQQSVYNTLLQFRGLRIVAVEASWRVGPTRILRLRCDTVRK